MKPTVAVVCGSGIVLDALFDVRHEEIPFDQVSQLKESLQGTCAHLPGHDRKFVLGQCGDLGIVVQYGRLHFYEGMDYETVAAPVEFLNSLGVKTVILTCAAGGLKPGMNPGDLVAIERVRMWRYAGWNATPGMTFPDVVVPDCDFTGTYQWMHGPCYETQAEISAIQRLQSDVVGMSSAPEMQRCQELGIRCGMVAVVTNSCCKFERLSHDRVIAAAAKASARLACLLRRTLPQMTASA